MSRPASGGLRQHLATLLNLQSQNGFDVGLAAPAELTGALRNQLPQVRLFPLSITDSPQIVHDLWQALFLASIVRRASPDIVHAHGIRATWISALSPSRTPRVSTVHNLLSLPSSQFRARALLFGFRRTNAAIAVSEAVKRSLSNAGVSDSFVTVIPNGIVLPAPSASVSACDVRNRFGIPQKGPLVLCVARLMSDKGVDVLVRSWPTVRSAHPDATCVIAGDGPDQEYLETLARPEASLKLAGRISDVGSLYAAADVLVIPSRREGQSIVCLEAMASDPGPIVVASSVGGLPEMVRDGDTGFLFPAEDSGALTQTVIRALDSGTDRQALTARARQMVLERYAASKMADRTAEIYASVVASRE